MKFKDFTKIQFLQSGGWGKVYSAYCASLQQEVALKFFGYTEKKPSHQLIEHEIAMLKVVAPIPGFIHFFGTIMDTKTGRIDDKIHPIKYPILVMEYLPMDIFTFISSTLETSIEISEDYIQRITINILNAINELHDMGYIHRDLKLENIMLTSSHHEVSKEYGMSSPNNNTLPAADATAINDYLVKIIDLGEMVKLPKGHTEYRMKCRPPGSLGYFAPETVQSNLNSPATDMFQIGCIVYAMLSGTSPFQSNLMHSVEGEYRPMIGDPWSGISTAAKEFVGALLLKNPQERMSCKEALNHPWIINTAPTTHLGTNYLSRVHHLTLKQKLKKFFLRSDVLHDEKIRKENISESILSNFDEFTSHGISKRLSYSSEVDFEESKSPLRKRKSSEFGSDQEDNDELCTPSKYESISPHHHSSSPFFAELSLKSYVFKLLDLKKRILNSFSPSCQDHGHLIHIKKTVTYDEFCQLMNTFDLSEFTNQHIFNIFDLHHHGYLRIKDFLLTLMTIVDSLSRESMSQFPSQSSSTSLSPRTRHPHARLSLNDTNDHHHETDADAAEIYFSLFDINGNGTIDKNELQILFYLLLDDMSIDQPPSFTPSSSSSRTTSSSGNKSHEIPSENSSPSMNSLDIKDLYSLIGEKDQITYPEFKIFYETIINTNTRGLGTLKPTFHHSQNIQNLSVIAAESNPDNHANVEDEESPGNTEGHENQGENTKMEQEMEMKKKRRVCHSVNDKVPGPVTRSRRIRRR